MLLRELWMKPARQRDTGYQRMREDFCNCARGMVLVVFMSPSDRIFGVWNIVSASHHWMAPKFFSCRLGNWYKYGLVFVRPSHTPTIFYHFRIEDFLSQILGI